MNQAPSIKSAIATANADGSISISVEAIDPENKTVGIDAYLWSEKEQKFINGSKKSVQNVASGSKNVLTWSSNDLKALGIANGSYKMALDVFDSSAGKRIYSNVVTIAQPIVDTNATVPKELTVNNGKASFVLKTTEAVASVQIKINGQTYNLVPDTAKKSWTLNATNLAQQGQVNYELAILKTGASTAIKQTGTINLKSSVVVQPLQKWQEASLAYAEKYHKLYANTPMTNVFGNVCGKYTFCYAFSRNADGIKIPSGFGNAFTAFGNLKNSAKYGQFTHTTTNFANIPLGSVVFFKGGTFGHAAIKVSATEMVSQGQPNCRITKVRFDSMKSLALVGYYAPSDGVTGLDDPNNANVIAP
ncbi:MAG TPA: hypothetical protein PK633_14080, partial [Agitococcus sp.]|nr:hypothetical protein [Agitococcus sp.]